MKALLRLVYASAMGITLALLLFWEHLDHIYKREFALSNAALLALDAAVLALLAAIAALMRRKGVLPISPGAAARVARILMAAVLFGVQIALCLNNLFEAGWDVAGVVASTRALANGGALQHDYYSMYPNNLMSVYLYGAVSLLLRATGLWETIGFPVDIAAFSILNCILSTLTGVLLWRCAHRLTGSRGAADAVWLLYAVLIGLSPWLIVPYSDSLSLLFPTLLLFISLRPFRRNWVRWSLLGGVGALAYAVKPQGAVMLIAIVLARLICDVLPAWRRRSSGKLRRWAAACVALCLTAAVCFGLIGGLAPLFGFELAPEEALGASHFLMMGLNEETNGSYYRWDVSYSVSFPTRWERMKANIDLALHRILWMGPGGLALHAAKKALVNFNDGTFAWKMDGGERFSVGGGPVFPTEHELLWSTALQAVWLGVLGGCLLYAFTKADRDSMTLWLCLLGVMAMVMLFECRARYLYANVPVFILAAVLGIRSLAAKVRRR
ncbi:MAG TPA: glycosyltransferase family 39 protein [Candidatus Limiplasma pullicola]|nr:glycosyltransferase family 39 protein [Candidatus Limiplasma pullicola]